MTKKHTSGLLSAFSGTAVLRSRELTARGFSRQVVANATERGVIERIGRGLYTAANAPLTEKRSYVEVARKAPKAVFCLLSACRFHELTTQNPREVWFAIASKAWPPRITSVKTRMVRFSGVAFTEGIEIHRYEGTDLRVYSVAKTIADLFRYRNKFGLDIALEALRDALRSRKCTIAQIEHFARIRRVSKVMEPYLTAYVAQ